MGLFSWPACTRYTVVYNFALFAHQNSPAKDLGAEEDGSDLDESCEAMDRWVVGGGQVTNSNLWIDDPFWRGG